MLFSGCMTQSPRSIIEQHLGVSPNGAALISSLYFTPDGTAPRMDVLRHELLKHHDMQNLTVGILMMPVTDELDVEIIKTNLGPADIKLVLVANLTKKGTTIVRPEDISNITVETNINGRIIGSFDWVIPCQLKGRCRFVTKDNTLVYLGILRKNPVSIYDCATIISPYGDMIASRTWIQTEYFVVIDPISERTKTLSRSARQKELIHLFDSGNIGMKKWISEKDRYLRLIYASSNRHTQDRVIKLLNNSKDWKIQHSGRAIITLGGPTLFKSIEEQIGKMEKKK